MKIYQLNSLRENKILGVINLEDSFQSFKLELDNLNQSEYQKVFETIIQTLNQKGDFNVNFTNWRINNSSKEFWQAFVQTLLLELNILEHSFFLHFERLFQMQQFCISHSTFQKRGL